MNLHLNTAFTSLAPASPSWPLGGSGPWRERIRPECEAAGVVLCVYVCVGKVCLLLAQETFPVLGGKTERRAVL